MKKMSTLFKKDPNDLGRVIDEINPENQWVFDGEGIATVKWDGTSCAIINGELYKRYDSKINKKTGKRKTPPEGAIPCQDNPDEKSGHWPHWVKCKKDDPQDKYHFEGLANLSLVENVTYELCGPKINGNKENLSRHVLIRHGCYHLDITPLDFEIIKKYLTSKDIEGIVFRHKTDDRKCKIRKSDFGIKR